MEPTKLTDNIPDNSICFQSCCMGTSPTFRRFEVAYAVHGPEYTCKECGKVIACGERALPVQIEEGLFQHRCEVKDEL